MDLSGARPGNTKQNHKHNLKLIYTHTNFNTHTHTQTDPPGLLFPSIPLRSSLIITPLGRGWAEGGSWWGTSACRAPDPFVLMEVEYWIWTSGCDWPGFALISCELVSTLICCVHNRWGESDGCCLWCHSFPFTPWFQFTRSFFQIFFNSHPASVSQTEKIFLIPRILF